jgi:hypothetical protein
VTSLDAHRDPKSSLSLSLSLSAIVTHPASAARAGLLQSWFAKHPHPEKAKVEGCKAVAADG